MSVRRRLPLPVILAVLLVAVSASSAHGETTRASADRSTRNDGSDKQLRVTTGRDVLLSFRLDRRAGDHPARVQLRVRSRHKRSAVVIQRVVRPGRFSERSRRPGPVQVSSRNVRLTFSPTSPWAHADISRLVPVTARRVVLRLRAVRGALTISARERGRTHAARLLIDRRVPRAPENVTAPTLTGAGQPGTQLTVTTGAWTGARPIRLSYQWQRCTLTCQPVLGAAGRSYQVTEDDRGARLQAQLSARNFAGHATVSTAPVLIASTDDPGGDGADPDTDDPGDGDGPEDGGPDGGGPDGGGQTPNTVTPDTTITAQPTDTTDTSATFTLTSEPDASFHCKLDSGAWTACSSPVSYTGLATGTHTFHARATDPAGNTDPSPATATWEVLPGEDADALHANPATLPSVFAAAQPGDTILLAAGSYGTFTGGQKAGRVRIKPAPAAAVTIAVNFSNARNITLDGLTFTSAELRNSARDITITGSVFTGPVLFRAANMTGANLVFDGNQHRAIDRPASGYEGRVHCTGDSGAPAGITIRRSFLGDGGTSDGIQTGCNGMVIENNEFAGFVQDSAVHTDPIQGYGQRNTVIRGNYLHDNQVASGVMFADGADHELIEHNVIDQTGGDPRTINLAGDDGSVIRHNTLVGTVMLKAGNTERASRLAVLKDNIVTEGVNVIEASTIHDRGFNLLGAGAAAGTDLAGSPEFAGGSRPSTKAGYTLAAGSPGKDNASDGQDRGFRVTYDDSATGSPGGQVAAR